MKAAFALIVKDAHKIKMYLEKKIIPKKLATFVIKVKEMRKAITNMMLTTTIIIQRYLDGTA